MPDNSDSNFKNNAFAQFFEAFSLSGAIIVILSGLTFYGVITHQEKVWQEFATALTTFISGKKLSDYEVNKSTKETVTTDSNPEVK